MLYTYFDLQPSRCMYFGRWHCLHCVCVVWCGMDSPLLLERKRKIH